MPLTQHRGLVSQNRKAVLPVYAVPVIRLFKSFTYAKIYLLDIFYSYS